MRHELSELYDKVNQQLFHCALSVTNSADLAEDAVHDAFIKAFRIKECPKNLKAYMFRSVRNSALDIVRRQSKMTQPVSDQLFESCGEEVSTHFDLDLASVATALNSLSDDQRETVLQHLIAGLTFREIAELHDKPLGTIATWYRRGIEKLRMKVSKLHE